VNNVSTSVPYTYVPYSSNQLYSNATRAVSYSSVYGHHSLIPPLGSTSYCLPQRTNNFQVPPGSNLYSNSRDAARDIDGSVCPGVPLYWGENFYTTYPLAKTPTPTQDTTSISVPSAITRRLPGLSRSVVGVLQLRTCDSNSSTGRHEEYTPRPASSHDENEDPFSM
jgi:hypothetical protein